MSMQPSCCIARWQEATVMKAKNMSEVFTWTITLRNGKVLRASRHPFHFYVDGDEKDLAVEAKS